MPALTLDIKAVGRVNAQTAYDQCEDPMYKSANHAILAYEQNVRDTLADYGVTDPAHVVLALREFWREVERLAV